MENPSCRGVIPALEDMFARDKAKVETPKDWQKYASRTTHLRWAGPVRILSKSCRAEIFSAACPPLTISL